MSCLRDDELEQLAAGAGTSDARAHVAACEECAKRLKAIEDNLALARELKDAESDSDAPTLTMDRIKSVWQHALTEDIAPRSSIKPQPVETDESGTTVTPGPRRLADKPQSGSMVDYELMDLLGQGGMGVVYEAHQTSVDRNIALKMILDRNAQSPAHREHFLSEAAVTGNLDHPNIIPIYDLGSDEKGRLFYSMKRVRGTSWNKCIGTKTLRENLDILMRVADAIAFAHHRGVIHRDLKPENVMLGEFGEVLVMDWGLAAAATPNAETPNARAISMRTAACGTPAYMAPEMALGLADKIGPLSDVYLLGAILFEIVTGERPHTGRTSYEVLLSAAENRIRPADEDNELIRVALTATSTVPADRYQSVQEFQAGVREHLGHLESIEIADRARGELAGAHEAENPADSYDRFAHAVFGYRAALEIWPGNPGATQGLSQASREYADYCLRNGDLDRALSLLDSQHPAHASLREEVQAAIEARDRREERLRSALAQATQELYYSNIALAQRLAREASIKGADDLLQQCPSELRHWEWGRVRTETHQEIATIAEHLDRVYGIDVSPDGRLLATGSHDGTIRLTDLEASMEPRTLTGHSDHVYSVSFSSDGTLITSGSRDGTARVWETETGRALHVLNGEAGIVYTSAFRPNGTSIAFSTHQGTVQVWDAEAGRRLAVLAGHTAEAEIVAFSSDGKLIASSSEDQSIIIWDVESAKAVNQWVGHGEKVLALAFSSDGRLLASGSWDGTVKIWNVGDWELVLELDHGRSVRAVAFSPDGKHLASGAHDNVIRIWDVDTGTETTSLKGHCDSVTGLSFSRDGSLLYSASADGTVKSWDPFGKPLSLVLRGHASTGQWNWVSGVTFTPEGRRLLTAGFDHNVVVWGVDSGTKLGTLTGHTGRVHSIVLSRDGRIAASAAEDEAAPIRIWDMASRSELRQLPGHCAEGICQSTEFRGGTYEIPVAGPGNAVSMYDAQTGKKIFTAEGHTEPVVALACSPNGEILATGGFDKTLRLWSARTGACLHACYGHAGVVVAVAFSPDGQIVVSGSGDNNLRMWCATSGEPMGTLRGHTGSVMGIAFSPDGKRIASCSTDESIAIWDSTNGRCLLSLDSGAGKVTSVDFSPDGRLLATGNEDNTARIFYADAWDEEQCTA